MKIRLHTVEDAGAPIRSGSNSYSCFNCVQDEKGVYVFQRRDTGEVLYIGEAGANGGTQKLAARVQQHYGLGTTGGNFQINWRKENCQKCEGEITCEGKGECNYPEYKKTLSASKIIFLCCETTQDRKIYALENLMKFIFLPKFDHEVMKMRKCEIDAANLGNIIRRIAQNESESFSIQGHEYTDMNLEAASFQTSYVLRIIAASASPEGILSSHIILKKEELDTVRKCLRTLVPRRG